MKWSRLRMRTTKGLIRWAEHRSPVTIPACLIHHSAPRKYFLRLLSLIHMCARDRQNKNNLITSLHSVRVLLSNLILPQLIYFPSLASCRLGKSTECQFRSYFKFWCFFSVRASKSRSNEDEKWFAAQWWAFSFSFFKKRLWLRWADLKFKSHCLSLPLYFWGHHKMTKLITVNTFSFMNK